MYNSAFLSTNQINELEKWVSQIRDKYGGKRKLASFIRKAQKKNLQKFYNNASFFRKEIKLSNLEVDDLINKKLLRIISKKEGRLTLTLKAILMVEYGIMDPSHAVSEMLNDFNKELFENIMGLSEELVTSKEKAIIIGLLGLDAISDQYPLKPDEKNKEYTKDVVDRAAGFIKDLGPEFDDGSLSTLWGRNVIGEGPVLAEMRRLNEIQPHTEGICKKVGGKHYLDILTNNKVNEVKLTYLLKEKIFDKRPLSFEEKKKLIKTLDEIRKYEFKIFKNKPPFDTLEVRKQIKRIIESNI